MSAYRHLDPLLLSIETPLRATFHPLEVPLEIETNDRRVLESADSSFRIFSAPELTAALLPGPASPGARLRMRLVQAPEAATNPPWPAPAYRLWRDLFAVVCGPDNFLTADLVRREAMGFFSPAMLEDREFFCWTFLECATYVLLVRHYFTPVHAACVVRDGQGICLCGPAGAGKTCLAYACARAGYSLLADDVVYLLRSERHPQLRGNPSRLHFPVPARDLFPELRQVLVGIRRDGREFLAVPAEEWLPGRAVTQAELGAVVFLERATECGAGAALEPVAAAEAHRLLFDALPPDMDEEQIMAAHRLTIEHLVQAGAYRLHYSTLEQAWQQLERLPLPERVRQ